MVHISIIISFGLHKVHYSLKVRRGVTVVFAPKPKDAAHGVYVSPNASSHGEALFFVRRIPFFVSCASWAGIGISDRHNRTAWTAAAELLHNKRFRGEISRATLATGRKTAVTNQGPTSLPPAMGGDEFVLS